MKGGTRMKIDYKALRKINPEAARMAVLEYFKTNGGKVTDCAPVSLVFKDRLSTTLSPRTRKVIFATGQKLPRPVPLKPLLLLRIRCLKLRTKPTWGPKDSPFTLLSTKTLLL